MTWKTYGLLIIRYLNPFIKKRVEFSNLISTYIKCAVVVPFVYILAVCLVLLILIHLDLELNASFSHQELRSLFHTVPTIVALISCLATLAFTKAKYLTSFGYKTSQSQFFILILSELYK